MEISRMDMTQHEKVLVQCIAHLLPAVVVVVVEKSCYLCIT